MRRIFLVTVIFLINSVPLYAASGRPLEPFYTRNLAPIVQIFGLPATEGGVLAESGKLSVRLVAEVASHYTKDTSAGERVLFDGETSRVTTSLRYGLNDNWEIGIDVPLVSHDGGVLDAFIEGWHDFFGLPQGDRDKATRGQLHYFYGREGEPPALDYSGSGGGIGDIAFSLGYRLAGLPSDSGRSLALRTGIKLPTGNSNRLRGSGGTDVHLRLAGTDAQTLKDWNLTLFASAGVLWLEQGDVLSAQQRRWVGFGSAGFGWAPLSWLDLKIQLDGHSSFYRNSRLAQIDSPSLQLSLGGTLHLTERVRLDLAVVEDIIVATAPDVVFHSALSWHY